MRRRRWRTGSRGMRTGSSCSWLPKYAPERNADEYLNNDLKGAINAEGLPGSQGELRSRIERFMGKLLHLPEHVRNYFRHPCVQYAAGD